MKEKIITVVGNPMILGAVKTVSGYNFAVVSGKESIDLNLYNNKGEKIFTINLNEKYKFGDIFAVEITGIDFEGLEYNYTADNNTVPDPYARQMCDTYEFGKTVDNAVYRTRICANEFDWEGDTPLYTPYSESIIYRMHVRGFTKHRTSKVLNKGTYMGIIEKLPYLKELGITAVELMPVFEFEEVQKWTIDNKQSMYNPQFDGKTNYWGYTEGMFFAPKAAYASKKLRNQDYTVEFKDMVKTLHKAGIEVIVEMYFPYETGINMIRDCVRYWTVEYHLDGVHLNCSRAALETVSNDPLLSKIKLFTNSWGELAANRSFKNLADYNYGFMNTARKLLKGDEDQLNTFITHARSNSTNAATVNFIANNNGFTLMDLVSYDRKHNENNGENNRDGEDYNNSWNCGEEGKSRKKKIVELRKKQIKNALLMVMLSQGTPLLMAGDEFGNSQLGNNNPYCQDNEVSWLDWKNLETNRDLFEFTKMLIQFRKDHGILHMQTPLRVMDYKACGYPDISYHGDNAWFASFENYNRHCGIMYCGKYANEDDNSFIYVAYNLHWEKHVMALPKLPDNMEWCCAIDSANSATVNRKDRTVIVTPRSVVVLVSRILDL